MMPQEIAILPTINAALNFLSFCFLILGFVQIKKGQRQAHKLSMSVALVFSAAFLACYLFHHYQVGSVPYPYYDWTRTLYYIILVPHVILAALMVPFIIYIVVQAMQQNFEKHKKWAKWVWPVWVYVSFTGVLIYIMLYLL